MAMSGPGERQSQRLAARGSHQPAAAGEPTATGYLMGQRGRLGTIGQGRQVAAAFVEVPNSEDPSQIADAIRTNAAGIATRSDVADVPRRNRGRAIDGRKT
ncbi:hypothetical protein WJX75_007209 [Coccomyxa subellipsoidea]|uniref:Uncharacterized protein n=1 Tax=Coccomyxa subellipsoidea TaxID=248742 RepID=A0ABR2YB12_9CHLO